MKVFVLDTEGFGGIDENTNHDRPRRKSISSNSNDSSGDNNNNNNKLLHIRSHLALGDCNEAFVDPVDGCIGAGLLKVGCRTWDREGSSRVFSMEECEKDALHASRRAELVGLLKEKSWVAANTCEIASWACRTRRTWARKIRKDNHLESRQQRQMDFVFVPQAWRREAGVINVVSEKLDHFGVRAVVSDWQEPSSFCPHFGNIGWAPVSDS